MSKDRDVGTVVHFNTAGGYGFIRGDRAGEKDIFFHASEITEDPTIGDKVSYELATDKLNRPCAKTVRYVTDEVEEEPQQMAADYDREERSALAQALRRAHHE